MGHLYSKPSNDELSSIILNMPDDNPSNSEPKNRLHPNVWVLSIGSYLTDISSEMIFNLLPLFLFNVLGVRTATIGLIDGIAETTASLMKIVSGTISDRIKQRKGLIVGGYLLSTLTKPFLYFATSWPLVLGVRFADRLGKGIRTSPRDALLSSSAPPERRGYAFGLHRAADTAGAFTGLLLAALILWRSQAGEVELTQAGFQQIVLVSIIPAVMAVTILALGLKEIPARAGAVREGPAVRAPWRHLGRTYGLFLLVMVVFTLGNSSDAFIILRAQERGLGVIPILGMLMTFTAVYTILSSPAGALSDRIGRRNVLIAGWLVYAGVYLGMALVNSAWQVWLLYALYGIYYAMSEGVARALVADLVAAEQRGTAYGLFHAAIGLTALPASLIAGILWQGVGPWTGFGPSAPFIFGAIMALIAATGLILVFPQRVQI